MKKAQFVEKKRNVHNVESGDDMFAFHVCNKAGCISVNFARVDLPMLIDSGASCNVVTRSDWEFLKQQGQVQM